MAEPARTLGFGVTFDTVAARTACGQLLTLSAHRGFDANPPHRHVNDYICIVLCGGFAELSHNGWRERRAGSFFVHEAGIPHHDRFGPRGAICLNMHFPSGEVIPGKVEGPCSAVASVAAHRLAFELAAGNLDDLVRAALAAEIIGQIQAADAGRDKSASWVDRIVQAISDQPRRRWSLCELAGLADRHPVHVAQAFRARTGVSLGAFQRLRRLTRLSLELRLGKDSLAILAADFGYFDQAHMNAEFRAAFGVSPGRYRREWN